MINPTNSNTAQKSFETEKKDNIIYVSPKLTGNDSLEQDYSPRMQEAPWQQEWIATSAKRKAALAQKQQQRTQQEENERCDQSGVLHLETNRVELQNGKVSNTGILCCKRCFMHGCLNIEDKSFYWEFSKIL